MAATLALALALAVSSTGGLFHHGPGGRIMPPGPGYGWGYPNGAPDGYGWVDYSTFLPIGADRTPDYYFQRYFAIPLQQAVFPNYYNPYVTRGQRYVPYAGCGGAHPAGGPPFTTARSPVYPYSETTRSQPSITPPTYSGRTDAPPVSPGGSGLIP
ncbi:MAG: hypothetical protein IRY99_19265 [Isosphaeraceae bacterium]|nr:hypothetical protein [Isosphaeraceae bacterium]